MPETSLSQLRTFIRRNFGMFELFLILFTILLYFESSWLHAVHIVMYDQTGSKSILTRKLSARFARASKFLAPAESFQTVSDNPS